MEGGGGKGVAYLGAIQYLQEELELLPIRPGETNQIQGIAGASAGAISALYLSMGFTVQDVAKELNNSRQFLEFFDDPQPSWYRAVDKQNHPEKRGNLPTINPADAAQVLQERIESLSVESLLIGRVTPLLTQGGALVGGLGGATFGAIQGLAILGLWYYLKGSIFKDKLKDQPIAQQINSDFYKYIYNVLYDGGLFPGFKVREFFQNLISNQMLYLEFRRTGEFVVSAEVRTRFREMSFKEHFEKTKVKLFITGANISSHSSLYFSVDHTPDFPVAEAVAISMNLPILYKPVEVDAIPGKSRFVPDPQIYKGLWVDGGLLNNLPIHAFDREPGGATPSSQDPNLRPLNPHTIAFRLMEGFPFVNPTNLDPNDPTVATSQVIGNLISTLLSPGEEGHLRTPGEREQTIELFAGDIATEQFAPEPTLTTAATKAAYNATKNYFERSSQGSSDPSSFLP